MMKILPTPVTLLFWFWNLGGLWAQSQTPPLFSLQPADTLHQKRFWAATSFGTATYTAALIGLNNAWYKDYPREKFHFFNDMKEWNQMDKMGHWFTAYNEARWMYQGARWTGLPHKTSAWVGFAGGELLQLTFEILDGYSTQWGFSVGDIGFNTLGSSLFLAQELGWHDQRITMKFSAWPVDYSNEPIVGTDGSITSLQARADNLYGTGPVNLFLKNYNTLVVWTSWNIKSFLPNKQDSKIPGWLNVAVGMGANNMYEGFGYSWQKDKDCTGNCVTYSVDPQKYPRHRQFFLSPDIDLTRLKVKKRWLKTALYIVNIFKIPAPAIEYRSTGKWAFHPIYF